MHRRDQRRSRQRKLPTPDMIRRRMSSRELEGHPNTDFVRSLADNVGNDPIDPDAGEQTTQGGRMSREEIDPRNGRLQST